MHFTAVPNTKPYTPILDKIDSPQQLRQLDQNALADLAYELREFLLYTTSQSGGHLGAGLGVVELSIALHYVFNTPIDNLVWDTGHQAYPHKILTGRRDNMPHIRSKNGIAAFPSPTESCYDAFGVGHSSTSISAVLGMAITAKLNQLNHKNIAIIGDGALTAGMAFEALNHAGHLKSNILVVLNDNNMSISKNVGALSNYFSKTISSEIYTKVRQQSKKIFSLTPWLLKIARITEKSMKSIISPSILFEAFGFNYIGPIDGHNLDVLIDTLNNMKNLQGPQFLHIVTTKGKGFAPAEKYPTAYHAVKKTSTADKTSTSKTTTSKTTAPQTYSSIFGQWICDKAKIDKKLMGITPAMSEGSSLVNFSHQFPDRYLDTGITEQHCVTLAAGLAISGMKPVVAIYSTFLQRAYDQLIHDICIQNLDVTFAIDRAGLVGEDGATHSGSFDLSYLSCIPNIIIMAPSDKNELYQMLNTAYKFNGPAAVRYPKGYGFGTQVTCGLNDTIPIGRAIIQRKIHGQPKIKVAILNFGHLLNTAAAVAEDLDLALVNMRFIKPLDKNLLSDLAIEYDLLVTLEENALLGGAGAQVNLVLNNNHLLNTKIINLGLDDAFIEHKTVAQMQAELGLDIMGVTAKIKEAIHTLDRQNE